MNVKDATNATVHDYPGGAESLAPRKNVCNFCNNTSDTCCSEADKANKALHIIDAQDEHYHDEADAHVFMLNGLLVAKDVVMPLEQGGN